MKIIKYPSETDVNKAISDNEPLLVLISFDGKTVITSQIDEAVEHHILLRILILINFSELFLTVTVQTGHLYALLITRILLISKGESVSFIKMDSVLFLMYFMSWVIWLESIFLDVTDDI